MESAEEVLQGKGPRINVSRAEGNNDRMNRAARLLEPVSRHPGERGAGEGLSKGLQAQSRAAPCAPPAAPVFSLLAERKQAAEEQGKVTGRGREHPAAPLRAVCWGEIQEAFGNLP